MAACWRPQKGGWFLWFPISNCKSGCGADKGSYLLTGCAILLRGRLLPFIASEGLGRALRPTLPTAAALFGVGMPELEYSWRPLDRGVLLPPPCTVGLT